MISLAEKTIEEINDMVHKGCVLVYNPRFDGVVTEDSRNYLVLDKKSLWRNKRIYSLELYEVGHGLRHEYSTSNVFQHRSHYHVIP
jgi:hypothetical protein